MSTVALTYEEIAERLGITVPSARRLVIRKRWSKSKGNDGLAVVQVPEEFLQRRDDKRDDSRDDGPDDDATEAETALPAVPVPDPAIVVMEAALTDAMARLATAQEQIVDLARQVGASQGELGALRSQMDDVRQERDRWSALAESHQRQIAELQAEKAAAATRRGWWPWKRRA